jgi:hypothetical protein
MSVKKSLLAVLAVFIAIGLLFTACPTESGSSTEGGHTYSQSELWKKISEAQTLVLSIPVSATGNDIANSQSYITPVQKNAFLKAIDSARTLAEAGVSGAEEASALEALTKAQAEFQATTASQKGKAAPASAADFTGTPSGNKIITENVSLSGATLGTASVTVGSGAKLTTSGTFTPATGTLIVKEGGTFEIGTGTTKSGDFTTTITLESGAVSIDKGASLGGTLFATNDDTGSYVINAGAVAKLGPNEAVFVGPSTGDNKGQMVQLNAGVLEIKATAYELKSSGAATLVARQVVPSLNIGSGSTVTIANGGELIFYNDVNTNLIGGTGARIVLVNDEAVIFIRNFNADTPTNIPIDVSIKWVAFADSFYDGGRGIRGPLTLEYNGTTWVKKI